MSNWLPNSFLDEFDSADIERIFIANNSTYNIGILHNSFHASTLAAPSDNV